MMKFFTYLFLLIGVSLYSQSADWLVKYDKAIKVAKKNNQNILVYFTGSDWCGPCKSLKADFFETEGFIEISEEIVLLKLDYPRNLDLISKKQIKINKQLLEKYNPDKKFPKVVILDKKGKVKDVESGYGMLRDPSPYKRLLLKYVD